MEPEQTGFTCLPPAPDFDTSEIAEELAMALGYILDNNPGHIIGRGQGMDALDRYEEHCKP